MTALMPMPTIESSAGQEERIDEAELAAAAFLVRYHGRALDAYRYDLRAFLQWAADEGLVILSATPTRGRALRPRDGGLRPCGNHHRPTTFHRLRRLPLRPHRRADCLQPGAVRPPTQGPPQRRPRPRPLRAGVVPFRRRAGRPRSCRSCRALGLNGLRVSEACSADIENLGFERGHRTLRIVGKGNKPAIIPLVPGTARTIDLAIGERSAGPILLRHDGSRLDRRTAHRWVRSVAKRAGLGQVHPHMLRAAFIMCALEAGVPLREVQIAARHADPRTTTVYDHRRQSFDRHAAYVVVAFVAGG